MIPTDINALNSTPHLSGISATRLTDLEHDSQRHDKVTADTIDTALNLQQTYGTSCALEYLKGKDIPNQITERILMHPEKRRFLASIQRM